MNSRVLDPNDPDDLREIKQLILEQELQEECDGDPSYEEEKLLRRRSHTALNLQFYSMIWFNYFRKS